MSGYTLPRSFVVITYVDKFQNESDLQVQADGNGDFSALVPLIGGTNVLEITGYGTSGQQARQFLQLDYSGTETPLELVIIEPEDGTVPHQELTVIGTTAPDALVVINDIIPAHPDEEGRWEATMFLQRGLNEIRITATLESQTASATINIEYEPGQG